MARIRWIEQGDATGELADAYGAIRQAWPPPDDAAEIFKALSHRPDYMTAISQAASIAMTPRALTSPQHEMISLYVSSLSECFY